MSQILHSQWTGRGSSRSVALDGGVSNHVSPMAHVADIGMLIQRAGFAIPTIDTDILTVEYPDPHALMRHLQGMGEGNANLKRRAYVPRATIDAAAEKYVEMFGNSDGSIPATFQVIYATGWKPAESQRKPLPRGSAKRSLRDEVSKYRSTTITEDDP